MRVFGGTPHANAARMHQVLFSVKRAFHKSTWFGRRILTGYSLTPSRFDILYLLHKQKLRHLWQSGIRRFLGVSAATTSILVRALEKLGFVRRQKSDIDRRQIEVALTKRGRDVIARALRVLRGKKQIIDYFVRLFVSSKWWDAEHAWDDLDRFATSLRYMRDQLKDRALLTYPMGHPDD